MQLTGITKSATFVNETYGDNKASANGGAIYVTKSASASKLSITDSSLKARFPPSPLPPARTCTQPHTRSPGAT